MVTSQGESFLLNDNTFYINYFYEIFSTIIYEEVNKENLLHKVRRQFFKLDDKFENAAFDRVNLMQKTFKLIYFDEISKKYSPTMEILNPKKFSKTEFGLLLLKQMKSIFGGVWGEFTYNSTIILFWTFLLRYAQPIQIRRGKKSGVEYLTEIKDFQQFLKLAKAEPVRDNGQALKWNYKKISVLLDIYKAIGLIVPSGDFYVYFGEPKFLEVFWDEILNSLKRQYKINNFVPFGDFLKNIDDNYFFIDSMHTGINPLPILIQEQLITLEKKKKIALLLSSDYKSYFFSNKREINQVQIL